MRQRPRLARGMTGQSNFTGQQGARVWYAFCVSCFWESPPTTTFQVAQDMACAPYSHACKRPSRKGRA